MLSVAAARAKVIEVVTARGSLSEIEIVEISDNPSQLLGRVLAENIVADRNYPPFNRSIRDGFAVRAADVVQPGAKLRLVGESRAGLGFSGTVGPGECVRILTGAPVPRGANAVVMQEFARIEEQCVVTERAVPVGHHFVLAGAEARVGEVVVPRGTRIGYVELAMVAEVGRARVAVSRCPRVAILSTGDELVSVEESPGPYQIRNSNSISLAAQVTLAGGQPIIYPTARDEVAEIRQRIEGGSQDDIIVLSGGVSVGKYDLVEKVLQEMGAEFFFDEVALRPGKPTVFGWCRGKPVFGLPGNPVSTMVTFRLFVAPAIELRSGNSPPALPFFKAKLAHPVEEKSGVSHFLPARVSWPGGEPNVEVLLWESSGDIGAVVRGNCFLVVGESKSHIDAGEWVDVLPRQGSF